MATHTPVQAHPVTRSRWALAIGLTVLGGLSWFPIGFGVAASGSNILLQMLVGAIPALTCLAAGWLLRSWVGLVVAAVVYIAVSAVAWVLFVGGGPSGMAFWTTEFAVAAVLPGVVMSAVGAAIGMYRVR